ncbi:MAG: hypothetical protein KDF54_15050 [Hydrogenophaga sp.]|nr:hypothetical protein [Hydrogenophaga sp.]
MPLSSVSRRRWLIAALVPLALAGCSALQTGPRHLDISEAQLLSRIAARFPVKQRYLGLFEVTLEQPRLRLLPEENRLGTEVDYLLGLPLPGQSDVKGKIELSYGLRFEPSDTTLRLTQARVERLDVEGLNPAQAAQVRKVAGLLTEDLLNEAVVHRIKPEDLSTLTGRGYRPGAIRVVPGGLRLALDPLPR